MNVSARRANPAIRRRKKTSSSLDALFLLAVMVSILLHGSFLYTSWYWYVADGGEIEERVEKLFKVQIKDLESMNFASRPTSLQLQEERQKALQEQVQKISEPAFESVREQLLAMTPEIDPVPVPEWDDAQRNDLFMDDQPAQQLITTEKSDTTVKNFEGAAGKDAVEDELSIERIPLMGRGTGSKNRILANLPEPNIRPDPVVSRSIATLIRMDDLAPSVPEFSVAEPPITLPPITELLPSPKLMRSSPGPASLQEEELAKEEIKERFVRLDDLLDVQLFTYHHIGGDGYFKVQIRPKTTDQQRLQILPKDVVLALDVSASMGRRRIGVVKDQVTQILTRLRPEDRFNIVGFKDDVHKFTSTLAPVSEDTLKTAVKFASSLESSGKTDIYTSLQPLVQLGTERARPLILLLFSDGRPTVGVVNSRIIINNLSRFLGPSTSIFCIGTGETLNRYLLDMLAFRNRGLVAFEQGRDELPAVIQSVYGYVEDPVLLRVMAGFISVKKEDVYPKILPDLYLKGELSIWGRLRGEEKIAFRLIGEAFDEQKEMIVELPIPEFDSGTYEIARNWAYHKAYHLVGRMVEEGEKPEIIAEIQAISRTYNIITPYSEQLSAQ
jgi:hypothetical protein